MDPRLFSKTVTDPGGLTTEVRGFLNSSIDEAVRKRLAEMGPEVHTVSLDVDFGENGGIRAAMVSRINSHFSVGLIGERKAGGALSGGFRVKYEWK